MSVVRVMGLAQKHKADYILEDTPWNFNVIPEIEQAFPNARYVVSLRDYRGVIQSMRKSFEKGYKWAGPTDIERAKLWADCYTKLMTSLPKDRTIIFDYDAFCDDPKFSIDTLSKDIASQKINSIFDIEKLTTQVAFSDLKTLPVYMDSERIAYRSISSFNSHDWASEQEYDVHPHIAETERNIFEFKKSLEEMRHLPTRKTVPSHTLKPS